MPFKLKPLFCDPACIKRMSERLIVSHYEKNYHCAIKRLRSADRGAAIAARPSQPKPWP